MISLDDVRNAQQQATGVLRRTPLDPSPALGAQAGAELYLKLENLQVTGSFKPRGPVNRLLRLTEAERRQGVVAATAGNHGLGLAWAGRRLEVAVTVCLPRSADRGKIRRLQDHGADLRFVESFKAAHELALELAERDGLTFVSAYNDPDVIAADGVVGLEIMEDLPGADLVIVPAGGGGLVSGIGTAVKSLRPSASVWLVESANSPTLSTWFRAGEAGPVEIRDSIAEGLAGFVEPETRTWPIIRQRVDRAETVTEDELVGAMRWLVEYHGWIVEPSGAAAVALALRETAALRGRRVAVVISGGNVAWERFITLVEPAAG